MSKQLCLNFEPVGVAINDTLLFRKEDGNFWFLNEIGFRTVLVPENSVIEIQAAGIIPYSGIIAPKETVSLFYIKGEACFYYNNQMNLFCLRRLWNNDVIVLLSIPNTF